jgi:aromatic-amino-acid transaminase
MPTPPNKVNLGVGVYFDDDGKIPLLGAVKTAEKARLEPSRRAATSRSKASPPTTTRCRTCCSARIRPLLAAGRAITCECLGGTGALKVGADYLKRLLPEAKVYISDPSWENHRALFESAGFTVENYAYYDAATRGVNFAGMKAALAGDAGQVDRRAARLLPQPDRRRPDRRAMGRSRRRVKQRDLVAFIDMAYQGFADGIKPDAPSRSTCSPPPACSSWFPAASASPSRSTASASAP